MSEEAKTKLRCRLVFELYSFCHSSVRIETADLKQQNKFVHLKITDFFCNVKIKKTTVVACEFLKQNFAWLSLYVVSSRRCQASFRGRSVLHFVCIMWLEVKGHFSTLTSPVTEKVCVRLCVCVLYANDMCMITVILYRNQTVCCCFQFKLNFSHHNQHTELLWQNWLIVFYQLTFLHSFTRSFTFCYIFSFP